MVPLAVELQVDAVVDDALAVHPLADAGFAQQLDRPLLEHARADPLLDVLAAAVLEDDALDPRDLEQPRERQARGARADDPDLRPHSRVSFPAWFAEAPLKETEHGLAAEGDGWFVLNARDAVWIDRGDRGVLCHFEQGPTSRSSACTSTCSGRGSR